ncbi:GreA/GreB family elongation factor [Paenibacillus sp. S150]|uniref:GreA/GreB family elongation factor n=1 Tax=Paenibacillus sp. S150 TaxID=2749826 RepID=UPI001C58435E|nr:GreA/GreB family elongation factor [Paenibacillus sp. S150]MBW4085832.1 GreA/GreB family elongation factor [Paenibacillus sp. S150]
MSHSLITDSLREELVRQLVYLDENEYAILDRVASESPADRTAIRTLIRKYQERVQGILSGTGDELERCVVLVGSWVSLQIGPETLKDAYRIVIPGESGLDEHCISLWSPMGRELLLTEPGETVTVHTPLGSDRVLVLNNVYDYASGAERLG